MAGRCGFFGDSGQKADDRKVSTFGAHVSWIKYPNIEDFKVKDILVSKILFNTRDWFADNF